jgi:hypothetical protein
VRQAIGARNGGVVVDEGVELAVLPARVHAFRQVTQEAFVECPPGKRAIHGPGIHADHNGPEAVSATRRLAVGWVYRSELESNRSSVRT